VKKHINFKCS